MVPHGWFPESITGRRVVLRRHASDNLAAFQRWYSDPEVARLTRYQEGPMPRLEIERFFETRVLGTESLALAIHVRATDRLIGTCAFSQLDGSNGSALFHITIGERDAWGQGYGTEATELMVAHAFDRLQLHRVALSVFAFNERAIRSYRKVGFVVEGRAREAIWRDGRHWDELQMSILDSDWAAIRAARERPGSPDDTSPGGGQTALDAAMVGGAPAEMGR
jgi:RimJ/RimL family protein N-acetyltransferase